MYYGNTSLDTQWRVQFINEVLNFLETAFAIELEKWKEEIRQSQLSEDQNYGYSWTQVEASNVLLKVKDLVVHENTIPFSSLPTMLS
jgi:hypothetical protein